MEVSLSVWWKLRTTGHLVYSHSAVWISECRQLSDIVESVKKNNFWNRLTLPNKILIFLRSLEEPFSGNSVKISDCPTCLAPASINYHYYYLCCHYCCCCYDFILPFNYWLSVMSVTLFLNHLSLAKQGTVLLNLWNVTSFLNRDKSSRTPHSNLILQTLVLFTARTDSAFQWPYAV